jgi:hypothetical protein
MKIRFILVALMVPLSLWAQIPKDEYETIKGEDPLESSYNKYFPGYYIANDGTQTNCLVLFESPDKLNEQSSNLSTALSLDGEVKLVDKRNLKAFFVNNRLYQPITVNGETKWCYIRTQGAIRLVNIPTYHDTRIERGIGAYYDEEKQVNVAYTDTIKLFLPYWSEAQAIQKLDQEAEVKVFLNRKNILPYVEDYPELATKIDNKEKGYKASLVNVPGTQDPFGEKMFNIYNEWYDKNNPGVITYFPTKATYLAPQSSAGQTNSLPVADAALVEEISKANLAPRIDPFEGRSTSVDPSVASALPEVPVKKESFTERINRLNAAGNKVGILVKSSNLLINPKPLSDGLNPAQVKGSYGPLTGLDALAQTTADRLNEAFGTDVFEVVDYQKIPFKEGKYGKYDDWWATKYKIVILYDLEPFYNAFYRKNTLTGEFEYVAYERVLSELILMAAEESKPDKLKYVIGSPRSMGSYKSDEFIGSKDIDYNIIQDLKASINPPSDDEIIKVLIEEQKEPLDKLIKKLSK